MKKSLILLSILFTTTGFIYAQKLELPNGGIVVLDEAATNQVQYVSFRISPWVPRIPFTITLSNPSNGNTTAIRGIDYDFVDNLQPINFTAASSDYFAIAIMVYNRGISREKVVFTLNLNYNNGTGLVTDVVTITIKSSKQPIKPSVPDTAKWGVRLVTGSNFDFFGSPTFKNFAGDLSIWLPDLIKISRFSIGLQAGFFNYRYFEADSSGENIRTDRYFLNPLEREVAVGNKYVSETYTLNSNTNFNTVGAYLNPIVRIGKATKWLDIFGSLHIEGLWRTEILSFNKKPLRKDTLVILESDTRGIVLQSYPGLRPTYSKRSYNDTYLGIGIPLKVNIKNVFEFYLAPTAGVAIYQGTDVNTVIEEKILYRTYFPKTFTQLFLLTKAQLTTTAGSVGLSVGGEFRKVGNQKTFYAVYAGASLPFDKLFK